MDTPTIIPGNRVNELLKEEAARMIRRRYQQGSLYKCGLWWYGRWREDEVVNGEIVRRLRNQRLGLIEEYPTRALAKRLLNEKLATVNSPNYRPRQSVTFSDFIERWLKLAEKDYRPSTWSTIKGHIENHIKPFFGAMQLRDIDQQTVKRFVVEIKRRDGKPAAGRTVRHIMSSVKAVWRAALDWEYVQSDRPVRVKLPAAHPGQRHLLTVSDVKQILKAAQEPYRTFYQLLAETGLRAGEVLALTIGDIERNQRAIRVRQSLWNGTIGPVKSEAARRTVFVSRSLYRRLLRVAGQRSPEAPLFASEEGRPCGTYGPS